MKRFAADPQLGLAGGVLIEPTPPETCGFWRSRATTSTAR